MFFFCCATAFSVLMCFHSRSFTSCPAIFHSGSVVCARIRRSREQSRVRRPFTGCCSINSSCDGRITGVASATKTIVAAVFAGRLVRSPVHQSDSPQKQPTLSWFRSRVVRIQLCSVRIRVLLSQLSFVRFDCCSFPSSSFSFLLFRLFFLSH